MIDDSGFRVMWTALPWQGVVPGSTVFGRQVLRVRVQLKITGSVAVSTGQFVVSLVVAAPVANLDFRHCLRKRACTV